MLDTEEETKPNPDQTKSLRNSKRLIKVKIGGRGAYSYIRNEPPSPKSKGFEEWEENDLIMFSWIVDNIEDDIISDFAHHRGIASPWNTKTR